MMYVCNKLDRFSQEITTCLQLPLDQMTSEVGNFTGIADWRSWATKITFSPMVLNMSLCHRMFSEGIWDNHTVCIEVTINQTGAEGQGVSKDTGPLPWGFWCH